MSEHFHFTAAQANMKRALALAKDFVSKESMLPVLHSVMLEGEADDSFLTLTATNLESVLRVRVAANVFNSGVMCATYTVLRDLVNTLPSDEPIEFKVKDDDRVEIVSDGRSQETNLILFDPTEYPLIPDVPYSDNNAICTLNGKTLLRVSAEVAPLAAADATRPTLTGVSLRFANGSLEAAATDGFRLARLIVPDPDAIDKALIMPAAAFSPLGKMVKLAADSQDMDAEFLPVRMIVDKENTRIFWAMEGGYIATVLINGNYPDYAPIIPKVSITTVGVEAKTAHDRAQIVSVIATESDNSCIYLAAATKNDEETFRMSAQSASVGDADGAMEAVVNGPDVNMAVSSKYLTRSLAIFKVAADEVVFGMTNPMEPLKLSWRKDDSLMHLIMPMHSTR